MSENGYRGVGFSPSPPAVPEKTANYHMEERGFHTEEVLNYPAYNGSPSYRPQEPQQVYDNAYANNDASPTLSPGLTKVYAFTPPIYSNPNNAKDKVRIVS